MEPLEKVMSTPSFTLESWGTRAYPDFYSINNYFIGVFYSPFDTRLSEKKIHATKT